MEIRIGITNTGRELNFETNETCRRRQEVRRRRRSTPGPPTQLHRRQGQLYIVPTASLAYIELGTEESRRVGFVA